MKVGKTLLALFLTVFAGKTLAEVVYVGGALHTLNRSDFQRSGDTKFTAFVDVIGDFGQDLVFSINGTIGGQGDQRVVNTPVCLSTYYTDRCRSSWAYRRRFSKEFRYIAEIQVTCSGRAIGSDMDNKNQLSDIEIANKYREVKLLVDKRLSTQGECKQLKIDLIAPHTETYIPPPPTTVPEIWAPSFGFFPEVLERGSISKFDLTVLIAEIF
ncbi:hypothetical protein [uncultured Microbulbifer sp.]|uniref:hypothetical protein n=1 Tax=uncultured Microbulbifer sp. TaxID=348147 RepID=UPI002615B4BE|nr:hypothetical protein [uncultured Microbulbifer sp.]